MPLISIFRLFFSLLSWAILAGAGYLLWRWVDGTRAIDEAGREYLLRDPWMLWVGLLLLVWSFLGVFVWRLVLARGSDEVAPARGDGLKVAGAKDGETLYVETTGALDAPTIIFTHGAGCDSTVWYLAKHELASRFRIITWDLPGLGLSRGRVDLDAYAENLRLVIEQAGAPVVLVGHSMGGMTIQTLARNHPNLFAQRVAGVALLNTTYINPLRTMILARLATALQPVLTAAFALEVVLTPLAWINAWQSYLSGTSHLVNRLTFGKRVTRTQLDHVSLLAARNPPASLALGNITMFKWDGTGAARDIAAPVLIIAGSGDIVTKPHASLMIASWCAEPRLHVVAGANHMSFLDHAGEYHELIGSYARERLASYAPKVA